jgi:diaminohydroxyphosphoribosylaminopyrimidine deaminase/5-amino-6-(5-phosphoribosylamino)uracil reductase
VAAVRDPHPDVAGRGLAALREAGLVVDVGIAAATATQQLAPYLKLQATGRPWVIAKWAMTLDGKIATGEGDSQWVTGNEARAIGHALRGRVDGILVGRKTAVRDDPLLTARPPGARVAVRIVADTAASLPLDSALVRTAAEVPLVVAASTGADDVRCRRLEAAGVSVWRLSSGEATHRLGQLLDALGRRSMTNLLVEGGGQLLGTLFDLAAIDEVHAFLATKLVGGADAVPPLGGRGLSQMGDARRLEAATWQQVGDDLYVRGRLAPRQPPAGQELPTAPPSLG